MSTPVFVTLGAYGADLVRGRGQEAFLPIISDAGASGAEIRRELFVGDDRPLAALRAAAKARGLRLFYSAPFELFRADSSLALDELAGLLQEAETLGSEVLKIAVGHHAPGAALERLRTLVTGTSTTVLIENDQTAHGGRYAPIAAFMAECARDRLPIHATFDIGNWRFADEDATAAAGALVPYVRYVHCKAVATEGDRLVTVPPDATDPTWRALVNAFPAELPRAIEFPLAGDDLTAVTRRYVDLLANA
jgi:sugar phosphate isomerase/epimerase